MEEILSETQITRGPVVSVVLSTKNGARYLSESVGSVLSQSYTDFELVIVDDGSDDIATPNLLAKLAKNDGRIRIITHQKSAWLAVSLNEAIRLAKGKFIARMDDDDIWIDAEKLAKQVAFLQANPNYGLVGTSMVQINEEGRELEKVSYRETDAKIREHILQSNQFAHPSVMFRRSVVESVGGYNEKYEVSQDYDLWLRIWKIAKFANLPDFCLSYRVRQGNLSSKKWRKQRLAAARIAIAHLWDYPQKLKGLAAHGANLILPRSLVRILVVMNKRIRW